MTDNNFNDLITRAMNELPQDYIKGLDNVAIVMSDYPSEEQRLIAKVDHNSGFLLGLYEGIPLTKRTGNYNFVLPDKITLFKNSLLEISKDESELFENIKRTLWHEIAHYYGLGHDSIDRLQSKHK